ncbi:NUDIX hydrolase [Rippkaea orientalis PCC 8801]|uniref:NUDIX hydrolase n=1 Tax=Rippkaea orientalis (strain PCC 8801 / RF-1) TaxID=41431 RepID=B7JVV3_RIPO1|nr:NUDIX hydrolase [Rippkaea orientalis]ACK65642.1 NUDIX hydrolase [Rippkaea orientalis PCC 8801]
MSSFSPTKATPNNTPPQVALAILEQKGGFLMQLRDDLPTILYPGHWGLFGGHLEEGETPEEGLKRELMEEINYIPPNPTLFRVQEEPTIIRYFYYASLTVPLEALNLQEGMDLALVSVESIQQGQCYSAKIDQVRPLGLVHRSILLDFFKSQVK